MKTCSETVLFLTTLLFFAACGDPSVVNTFESRAFHRLAAQHKNSQPHPGTNTGTESPYYPGTSTTEDKKSGTQKEQKPPLAKENYSLPPELSKAIQEANIPIYEGDDPPNVEGYYLVRGSIIASKHGRPPGSPLLAYDLLFNQTPEHSIEYKEFIAEGRGWISGQNNYFIIYIKFKYINIPDELCTPTWSVFSGIKEEKILHTVHLSFYQNPDECRGVHWEKFSLVYTPMDKDKPPAPGEDDGYDPGTPSPPPSFPFP